MSEMVKTRYKGLMMSRQDQAKLSAMLSADPEMCVQYILIDNDGEKHYISECMGYKFVDAKLSKWEGTLTWRKHYHTRRDREAAEAAKAEKQASENA